MVNQLLTKTLREDQLPDPVEQKIPDLGPSCALKGLWPSKPN